MGVTSETYIGWPNSGQAKAIVKNCDRVLLHAYVSNESTTYNYTRNRLIDLAGAASLAKIIPIFSAEPSFMGPWVQVNTPLQAYTNYNNNFIAETGTWKSNVSILGYQWFAYSFMPKALTTGLSELKNVNDFYVMPNPSINGVLDIRTDFSGEMKLVDSFGKEVLNFNIEKNKIAQINTSVIPNAIYYLVSSVNGFAKKIVVLNH